MDRNVAGARPDAPLSRLIADYDWTKTSLGPRPSWPTSLETAVGIVVHSQVPIVMLWGEDGVMIYNDAYSIFAGGRHPTLLGSKVREGWPEVADFNDNVLKVVLAGGTLSYRDQELTLHRTGAPQQVWMDLDYSPIYDETGKPAGVIAVVIETTERVLAERARALAEVRASEVLEGMTEGFMLLDRSFRVIAINSEGLRLERRTRDEMVGKTHWELWPGTEHSEIGALYKRAMSERVSVEFDHRYVWSDGREAWIEMRAYPSGDGLAVFYRDVSERKRDLDRLRESEDHYRNAVELDPQTAWTAGPDGQLDHVGTRWFAWTGTSGLGESWAEGLHVDDRAATFEAWSRSVATGEPYDIEHRVKMRDGGYRWAHSRAYCRKDEAGRIVKWYGKTEDVHDRRMAQEENARLFDSATREIEARRVAEAALAASEAKFRAIADYVDQMIWSTTPDGHHDYFNQRWYDYTGVPFGSTDGEAWNDVFHRDDRERAWEIWRACLATGEPYHIEYRLRHHTGQYRWVLGRAQPVRNEAGDILRWYGTCTDIQEIVEAREVLARSRTELERLVAARTQELEQAQEALRQAQKMEAVGQLTGGIAHDFNNMLAVVIGSLDLLSRRVGSLDARARKYVDAASDGARRAATLTQRLLAFSRQQPLRPEPVQANRLVAGMADLLRGSLGAGIEFNATFAPDLWWTHADPNQLENVILNLAVNARDAMPEGGRLTIETSNARLGARDAAAHPGVTPGEYVLIAVRDTGAGMPPDIVAKAFEPFFTTKEVGKGTGLGLSQAYGFIRQSGGHVTIDSIVGEGTDVKVYLPRFEREEPQHSDERGAAPVPMSDQQELVLVVEDEPAVRQFSISALEELGYRVLEADGAATALRLLDAHPDIALLFTDIVMPQTNGRKLADEARRRRPGLKVLFTTGYTRNAVVHNGVLDPGVDLIGKPYTIEDLAARVRDVLDRT